MLLKDLIVLGRACPEPLKDGRVTVCLAGWSETQGFIRIYPTRFDAPCKQWDVIEVDVELNERDTRLESRKIVGSREEWETLSSKIKVIGAVDAPDERRRFLYNLRDPSVEFINDARRSLGVVKPHILNTYFADNPKYGQLYQQGLPGFTELEEIKVKRDFPFEPRVKYTCPEGDEPNKPHDQQILEWGFYEWQRKNPEKREQVWENAGFGDSNRDIYFLIGNQAAHRNAFMVIGVLRVPTGDSPVTMFPLKRLPTD